MITVRSPLPSYVEIARRQMERHMERIDAEVEAERKRRLDGQRAREAADAVERAAAMARRQAELEAEAAKADAEIRSIGIIPVGSIMGACAAFYGVPVSSLLAGRRTKDIVKPRQIAMYLAKELTPRSLPDIGRRIGGRDHTTVLHGVRKIAALLTRDPSLAAEVATIRAKLVDRSEGGRETRHGHDVLRAAAFLTDPAGAANAKAGSEFRARHDR